MSFVVDPSGNIINNIVLGPDWKPPAGHTVVEGDYDIGGTLINNTYTPPKRVEVPIPQVALTAQQKLASIGLTPADLRTLLGLPGPPGP